MKAKKSLGQHFLTDKSVLRKIITASRLNKTSRVLEIGPGTGVLTNELLENAGAVLAIEKDEALCGELGDKFGKKDRFSLVCGDVMKLNIPELLEKHRFDGGYKLVANLPYYITSSVLRLFLETKIPPEEMIVMVQKEVGERICAKPGKMSLLSVSVQYYAEAEYLFTVGPEAFSPPPEVSSAVVRIRFATKHDNEEVKRFFRVVRAGFSARRKTLVNNLSNGLHLSKEEVADKLHECGISPTARAQELSIEQWKKLSEVF